MSLGSNITFETLMFQMLCYFQATFTKVAEKCISRGNAKKIGVRKAHFWGFSPKCVFSRSVSINGAERTHLDYIEMYSLALVYTNGARKWRKAHIWRKRQKRPSRTPIFWCFRQMCAFRPKPVFRQAGNRLWGNSFERMNYPQTRDQANWSPDLGESGSHTAVERRCATAAHTEYRRTE